MEEVALAELIDLQGKTAIVTGGAMGIGKGIAARLHEAGANIVIADLDEAAAHATADGLSAKRPNSVYVVKADVASVHDVTNVVQKAVEQFNSIDILVNNAGIFPSVPLSHMSEDAFMKVIDTNLRSVFLFCKHVSDQMIKQGHGGKIINVTSIDALHPSMIGLAQYDASKHGVWGFTKNIALELAQHKIWVNAIAPGGVATPGVAKMQQAPADTNSEDLKKATEAFLATIPMHRMGDPDDIGRVALFLASELSSYMTGTQVVVDGGVLLT